MKFNKSKKLFGKVERRIPLASQTFSKSYLQYVEGASPLFIEKGSGSTVTDVDGNEFTDMIMGLLPVVLGYRYKEVDKAISKQLKKGITFSLPSPLEVELADLFSAHVPCAEMVRFGKNGSDVTTGAVRLARAVTGREHVVVCGFHGWHDWYIGSTTRDLGVPKSTKALTHKFTYNDIESLKTVFAEYPGQVAAVIMEPENYEEPKNGFLSQVLEVAHKNGALLIFDEVITGFRWSLGGAQKYYGVTPDLACFGKAVANGMPLSVLAGKKEYMKIVSDIFYSSTFGGETLSIASAIATIKEIQKKDVIGYIWKMGEILKLGTEKIIEKHGLGKIIQLKGKPCWQIFSFEHYKGFTEYEIKSFIQQEVIQSGFLWYGQHNMSYSHTEKQINNLLSAYDRIFGRLSLHLLNGTLRTALIGKPICPIFKVR